jgi:hypothetical protein
MIEVKREKKKYLSDKQRELISKEVFRRFKEGDQPVGYYAIQVLRDNFTDDYYNKKCVSEVKSLVNVMVGEAKEIFRDSKEFIEEKREFLKELEDIKRMKELRDNNDPQYMKKEFDDEYSYLDRIDIAESENKGEITRYPEKTEEIKNEKRDKGIQFKINFR